MTRRIGGLVLGACLCLMNAASARATILFDFQPISSSPGPITLTDIGSGLSVTATGWALTGNSLTTFETALLRDYPVGIGICNNLEPAPCDNGTGPDHQIDNLGQVDFVLFQFSAPVTSVVVNIKPIGGEAFKDVTYFVGNSITPLGLTLAGLGLAEVDSPDPNGGTSGTTRQVTLQGVGGGVTSFLFGASVVAHPGGDFFKIQTVTVESGVPEPATLGLVGGVLFGLGALRIRQRRRS